MRCAELDVTSSRGTAPRAGGCAEGAHFVLTSVCTSSFYTLRIDKKTGGGRRGGGGRVVHDDACFRRRRCSRTPRCCE